MGSRLDLHQTAGTPGIGHTTPTVCLAVNKFVQKKIHYPPYCDSYQSTEYSILVDFMQNNLLLQNKNIGYIVFNWLCWDSDIDKVLSEIKNSDNGGKIFILDGSLDDYSIDFCNNLAEFFTNAGVDFIMVTGNAHYLKHPHSKIFYYPCFWIRTQTRTERLDIPVDQPKKYIFSSLNGIARMHRILLAEHLLKKPYVDQCCLTFNHYGAENRSASCWDQPNNWWYRREFPTEQDRQLLVRAKNFLPYHHSQISQYRWDDHSNLNAAYIDTYVNIITETNVYETFFTEKTFKALASGQFFISINGAGSIEMLKTFGFDTFDDIIDHSYDAIQDPREKIQVISQLLDQLVKLDWPTLWSSTQQRRDKNVDLFFSDAHKTLSSPFNTAIKNL